MREREKGKGVKKRIRNGCSEVYNGVWSWSGSRTVQYGATQQKLTLKIMSSYNTLTSTWNSNVIIVI